jgi:hypothetical protein
MQLRHLMSLLPPQEGVARVTAFAWSPNNVKLAVVTVDRVCVMVLLLLMMMILLLLLMMMVSRCADMNPACAGDLSV